MHPIELPQLSAQPLVSVLMTNYNYERFVGQAIKSVIEQSYRNLEVVVCDDGSSDNSCQLIDRYVHEDPRVILIRQGNAGEPAAHNAAFSRSHGEILCILDADDFFHPQKVEQVVRTFQQKTDVGFVIHPLIMVDGDGQSIQPVTLLDNFEEGWIADKVIRRGGRWRNMTASGISFRRELAAYVYPLPSGIISDLMFNTLLPLVTRVGVIREYLAYYRVHGGQVSSEIRNYDSVDGSIRATKGFLRWVERGLAAVNERITELGLAAPQLDLHQNLDYELRSYALGLLTGTATLGDFVALFPKFRTDDLYNFKTKAALLGAYGLALAMPRPLRARLIAALHLPNRLKYYFFYASQSRRSKELLKKYRVERIKPP